MVRPDHGDGEDHGESDWIHLSLPTNAAPELDPDEVRFRYGDRGDNLAGRRPYDDWPAT